MAEHEQPHHADLHTGVLTTMIVVSLIGFIVAVIGAEAYFRHEWNEEMTRKVVEPPNYDLEQLRREQLANITTDAQVPIERAMALVAEQYDEQ